jgi:hypothetical protein
MDFVFALDFVFFDLFGIGSCADLIPSRADHTAK